MISKAVLKLLAGRALKDAQVLLDNRRYASSIYIGGYALEFGLKYRICQMMQFDSGFPENAGEFNHYVLHSGNGFLKGTIQSIRHLKTHDLRRLLDYSGEEFLILENYRHDWDVVSAWDVALRYNARVIRKAQAENFYRSAKLLAGVLL